MLTQNEENCSSKRNILDRIKLLEGYLNFLRLFHRMWNPKFQEFQHFLLMTTEKIEQKSRFSYFLGELKILSI